MLASYKYVLVFQLYEKYVDTSYFSMICVSENYDILDEMKNKIVYLIKNEDADNLLRLLYDIQDPETEIPDSENAKDSMYIFDTEDLKNTIFDWKDYILDNIDTTFMIYPVRYIIYRG